MRILVIGGYPWSLTNFRGQLMRAMISNGHKVFAIASGNDSHVEEKLYEWGISYRPVPLSRAGINPFADLLTLARLIQNLHDIKPDIILTYTIKPVIYGGFAASIATKAKVYSLITGLGYAFMSPKSFLQRFIGAVARELYRISLRKSVHVFFQNSEDMTDFLRFKLVQPRQAIQINGSGVDLDYYSSTPLPEYPSFLLIARLLADKGVREYAEAARLVKKHFPHAIFKLAGSIDSNPTSIQYNELVALVKSGHIDYLGYLSDVKPSLDNCRVYVLPSYREGTPRTVLEAMSVGRPIITTDTPGCRDTVILTDEGRFSRKRGEAILAGENGFLVRARDAQALAEAMLRFLHHPEIAISMSRRSREIAEEKYDVHKVNNSLLRCMGLSDKT